jgi:hypothetical protein
MIEEWPEVNQLAAWFEKVVNMGKLAQAQRSDKFPRWNDARKR